MRADLKGKSSLLGESVDSDELRKTLSSGAQQQQSHGRRRKTAGMPTI